MVLWCCDAAVMFEAVQSCVWYAAGVSYGASGLRYLLVQDSTAQRPHAVHVFHAPCCDMYQYVILLWWLW